MAGALLQVATRKKCTRPTREAHFQVKSVKTRGVRSTFASCKSQKVHAAQARSTFGSQKCKNITIPGTLLQGASLKKCTRPRREAHFQVKSVKTLGVRSTFDDMLSVKLTRRLREKQKLKIK